MIKILIGVGALVMTAVQPAAAATIVDTGGGGHSSGSGLTLSGNGYARYPYTIKWAAEFSINAVTTITSLEAAIYVYEIGAIDYQIFNATSGLPETSAALFARRFTPSRVGNSGWTGPTDLAWRLAEGSYWFALSPPSGSTLFAALERYASHPAIGYADSSDSYPWRFQYNSFDLRILGSPSSVPEPAAWTMLVIGFGLIGAEWRLVRRALAPRHP
jgi:hypothetical protein